MVTAWSIGETLDFHSRLDVVVVVVAAAADPGEKSFDLRWDSKHCSTDLLPLSDPGQRPPLALRPFFRFRLRSSQQWRL